MKQMVFWLAKTRLIINLLLQKNWILFFPCIAPYKICAYRRYQDLDFGLIKLVWSPPGLSQIVYLSQYIQEDDEKANVNILNTDEKDRLGRGDAPISQQCNYLMQSFKYL